MTKALVRDALLPWRYRSVFGEESPSATKVQRLSNGRLAGCGKDRHDGDYAPGTDAMRCGRAGESRMRETSGHRSTQKTLVGGFVWQRSLAVQRDRG